MRLPKNRVLEAFGEDEAIVRPHLTELTLRGGDVLSEAGEEIRFVYFPHGGAISKLMPFADGSEVEAAIVGRDGAIGATVALGLALSFTRDVCHVGARASRLPADILRQAYLKSPRIQWTINAYALWKLSSAVRNSACNARHSVAQRLCRWLLVCSDVLESAEIPVSQDVFGKMLGVQRTSINPILQDLRASGAVRMSRSRLVVADPSVLRDRACECYAEMCRHQRLLSPGPPSPGCLAETDEELRQNVHQWTDSRPMLGDH